MRILISYRRADTAGYSGRLYDALAAHFGEEDVFMDISAIRPGEDFVAAIKREVSACDAMVVIIGRQWLTVTDESGRRRLDDPGDFVNLEVESGLGRAIPVIPVLVQEARMPRADELPGDLRRLARRNAIELSDERWRHDCQRLIDAIVAATRPVPPPSAAGAVAVRPAPPDPKPQRRMVIGATALGCLVVGVALFAGLRSCDGPGRPGKEQLIGISRPILDFEDPTTVGGVSAPHVVRLTALKEQSSIQSSIQSVQPTLESDQGDSFDIDTRDCRKKKLAVGESCDVSVRFVPKDRDVPDAKATIRVVPAGTDGRLDLRPTFEVRAIALPLRTDPNTTTATDPATTTTTTSSTTSSTAATDPRITTATDPGVTTGSTSSIVTVTRRRTPIVILKP